MTREFAFGKLDFKWDNPPDNKRKIFISEKGLQQLEFLGIDLDAFLEQQKEIMERKDFHYAYIGKCQEGYSVAFHQFSDSTKEYCRRLHSQEEEG